MIQKKVLTNIRYKLFNYIITTTVIIMISILLMKVKERRHFYTKIYVSLFERKEQENGCAILFFLLFYEDYHNN